MKTLLEKPVDGNFFMPAEFSEHASTLMLWPERRDVWRNGARPAQFALVEMAEKISKFEKVIVGVNREQFMNARALLPEEIEVIEVSYDDAWIRDTGPCFITDGKIVRGVDWNFNAWGGVEEGSYFPWMQDDLLPQKILGYLGMDRYKGELTIEGGAIHVDGEGTLIATKQCILNENRNMNRNEREIEKIFSDYLGIEKVIWLEQGLYLEENDGHIDNMCAFIKPGEVFLAWTNDRNDPQYRISQKAYEKLANETDARGRNIKVRKLELPQPLYISREEHMGIETSQYALARNEGDRLPASYTNYYFVNGGVVIPQFGCKEDQYALEQFEKAFPERKIIPQYVREFLLGGGGLHCMSMQVPA